MVQVQMAPYAGVAYLNGAATEKGHAFKLHLYTKLRPLLDSITKEKPDLIGFTCMTSFVTEVCTLAGKIKEEFQIPIIIGGPHASLCPEIIDEGPFDIVCRGEGELALVDLLDAIDAREDYTAIRNLWVKQDGNVFKNEPRPLIEPLDQLPLIDWSCYEGTPVQDFPPMVHPIRGCPYSCTYCFNEATRRMYKGLGSYIRHFSVERTIEEVNAALRYFSPSPVVFNSDVLGLDLDWMEKMLDAYTAATDRPFFFLIHPERITERCVDILTRHNCCGVAFGVESGSERVRREVLNRHYSNELLLEVAERLHKRGIGFRSYNIVGIPTETEDELWETIDINIKMKADFPRVSICTPMPETRILEIAKAEGLLDSHFSFADIPHSILMGSVLKNVDIDRIENSACFFITAVKLPRLRRVIKWLTHTKHNFLYRWWGYFVFAYYLKRSEQRRLIPHLKSLWANRHWK